MTACETTDQRLHQKSVCLGPYQAACIGLLCCFCYAAARLGKYLCCNGQKRKGGRRKQDYASSVLLPSILRTLYENTAFASHHVMRDCCHPILVVAVVAGCCLAIRPAQLLLFSSSATGFTFNRNCLYGLSGVHYPNWEFCRGVIATLGSLWGDLPACPSSIGHAPV